MFDVQKFREKVTGVSRRTMGHDVVSSLELCGVRILPENSYWI